MFNDNELSAAALVEKLLERTAMTVFLVALMYLTRATQYTVTEEVAQQLANGRLVLGILVILLLLPTFIRFMFARRQWKSACRESEGFISDIFTRACEKSFSLTFVFLIIMEVLARKVLQEYPGALLIQLTIAFSLLVFSVTFYWFNRSTEMEESENEQVEEQH